ncbi:hypothetical protein BHM03_00060033 [Ensete ventricosum]|nr:hypothetical protein BHM03_00060033 [Ensete ventricosum]
MRVLERFANVVYKLVQASVAVVHEDTSEAIEPSTEGLENKAILATLVLPEPIHESDLCHSSSGNLGEGEDVSSNELSRRRRVPMTPAGVWKQQWWQRLRRSSCHLFELLLATGGDCLRSFDETRSEKGWVHSGVLLCRQQADILHPVGNAATEVPRLIKADAAAVKHEEDCLGQGQYSVVTHCNRATSADQCVASSNGDEISNHRNMLEVRWLSLPEALGSAEGGGKQKRQELHCVDGEEEEAADDDE